MFPKIIVSMTTFPARFSTLPQVIEPILRQTVMPDVVQLWLSEEEFAEASEAEASQLDELARSGVDVRWCDRNLKPHNKYYGALQGNSDDVVITVDDDIVYPLTFVQHLLEMHFKHPRFIVANRTHMITVRESGELSPYKEWDLEQKTHLGAARHDLIATGVGGVLYPPRVFDDEVFDADAICELSLLADDLWLMVHEMRLGIPVVNTLGTFPLSYIPGSQEKGLYLENLENGRNDAILAKLFDRYPEVELRLKSAASSNEVVEPSDFDADLPNQLGFAQRLKKRVFKHV
ncbi:MAG: hypothetical protein KH015_16610 [Gordonibacter pamelaeae]|uniref:hypothetical protein n=2 Tax=Gordonibacter pamelaeae TaxID=471189 RepID=UPI0024308C7B|nr:hypothetical protein [Gordonibacter pamelaeae]MBS4897364.1 hypothetical protein [Gordonibacter pamelaeae]